MATKVVVCPECESALEPGRFSCPTCGALVAAVASMPRSFTPAFEAVPPVVEPAPTAPAPDDAVAALATETIEAEPLDDGWDPIEPAAQALPDAEPIPDVSTAGSAVPPSLSATPTAAASYTQAPPEVPAEPPAPTPFPAAPPPAVGAPEAPAATYTPAPPATSWPEWPVAQTVPAWPTQALQPEPAPDPDPEPALPDLAVAADSTQAPGWPGQLATPVAAAPTPASGWPDQPAWPPTQAAVVAAEPALRTPAGAYLPPSAVLPPAEALPMPGRNGTGGGHAEAAPAAKATTLAGRLALGDADGPLGLPLNAPGRTIALGAAIAGLGFLLPWAEIVIGSSSMGSFLDMWGLAGPGHPIILLLLIAVGFLAVAHEKWPVRVGAGTASIVLGSVLLGLAFPYVMGPFREAVGVYVTAAGAIVMIVGGLLARVPPRHADAEASV